MFRLHIYTSDRNGDRDWEYEDYDTQEEAQRVLGLNRPYSGIYEQKITNEAGELLVHWRKLGGYQNVVRAQRKAG